MINVVPAAHAIKRAAGLFARDWHAVFVLAGVHTFFILD